MSEPPSELADQPLCVGCGMCCDGTLYGRARVSPGEEPRIVAAGLELLEGEENSYFRLPCQYFGCGRCTIYKDRFDVCRTFTCALYRRLEGNEVAPEEARSIVNKALALRDKVISAYPDAKIHRNRQELRNKLADQLSRDIGEARQSTARNLLNIIALDTFVERWFRNKKDQDQDSAGGEAKPANS